MATSIAKAFATITSIRGHRDKLVAAQAASASEFRDLYAIAEDGSLAKRMSCVSRKMFPLGRGNRRTLW
jgi:hypothetical protein